MFRREKVKLNDCSSRMTLNMRNLCRIIESCSKVYWSRMKEKLEETIVHDEINEEQAEVEKKLREM